MNKAEETFHKTMFVLLLVIATMIFMLAAYKGSLAFDRPPATSATDNQMPFSNVAIDHVSVMIDGMSVWIPPDAVSVSPDRIVYVLKSAVIYQDKQPDFVRLTLKNNKYTLNLENTTYKWKMEELLETRFYSIDTVEQNIPVEK